MIRETLESIELVEKNIQNLPECSDKEQLKAIREKLLQEYDNCSPDDRVFLARLSVRPHAEDIIKYLFDDFFEQVGDRLYDDDKSILGGIALYHDRPVTVIAHRKGHNAQKCIDYNFGMPRPEGYRKALRIMEQAEKFGRPIITFIDTPGAYPGIEAEAHGQGCAIANNLAVMSRLSVPIISVVTGEGNSGGALAIGVANKILMMENAIYSVISPEGFASILWKDSSKSSQACPLLKITAKDLLAEGIADEVIEEPRGGAQRNYKAAVSKIDEVLWKVLTDYDGFSKEGIILERQNKFRRIGQCS